MATKNDVTGDSIVSRSTNKNYSDGWDRIFGKKKDPYEEATGKPYDPTSRTEDFIFPKNGIGQGSEVEALPEFEMAEGPINALTFGITHEQRLQIEAWLVEEVYPAIVAKQKLNPNYPSWSKFMGKNGEEYPYEGAIGGGLTYSFTPTGIGEICKVKYSEFELDVTDYDSF